LVGPALGAVLGDALGEALRGRAVEVALAEVLGEGEACGFFVVSVGDGVGDGVAVADGLGVGVGLYAVVGSGEGRLSRGAAHADGVARAKAQGVSRAAAPRRMAPAADTRRRSRRNVIDRRPPPASPGRPQVDPPELSASRGHRHRAVRANA
jgi:hypothetical protein